MLLHAWNFAERTIVGVLGGLALLLAGYQVVTRYFVPRLSPDWGEEVMIYLVVWGAFLAASSLAGEGRHVRADLIVRRFGPEGQRAAEIFNTLATLAFTGALVWFGWEVVDFARMLDERSISSIKFPIAWYYLCLPVGMALVSLRYLIRLYELLFRFDPARHTIQDPVLHELREGEIPND